ncbi:hypothetical protein HS5_11090 [Acidianus sp. HS-5]|nr:hypothetical protein HS5_11090 [Acidianus sp. HS-5]
MLKQQLEEMTKKPKLEVGFDYSALDNPVNIGNIGKAKFVRVKVYNKGNATARKCIAKAEIQRNGKWESFGGVLLHWIRYWEGVYGIKEQFMPVDIVNNDNEIADLIIIVGALTTKYIHTFPHYRINFKEIHYRIILLSNGLIVIVPPYSPYNNSILRCNRNPTIDPIDPIDYRAIIRKDDIIKVTIYCDNATSDSICLKVINSLDYYLINSHTVNNFLSKITCP